MNCEATGGSLVEFYKRPYNPATPVPPKSPFDRVKRFVYLLQFLVESVPVWLWLLVKWLFPGPPKNITGWNALVTGGSNGIGRAVALELARSGCNVVIVDIDEDNGRRTLAELLTHNVKAAFYKVDVACYEEIDQLGREIGPVDILVNNASVLPFLVPDEYSPENIRRTINVNILSHFWTIKTFLPGMYERRQGHIVALSSLLAYLPEGYTRSYSTTKYAIRGFMEELHDEIYHAGFEKRVKTTTVFPAIINTRKECIDVLRSLPNNPNQPVYTPEEAGRRIVEGIKRNTRKLVIYQSTKAWQIARFEDLPRAITRLYMYEIWK
ncbi:17-beta-hydroxysteroid dehydrogenase 13-like [Sabethes cyaneus]|uniref:17-beta-hydroxysteroid dehydrogenase 13-like n=1 Tax=Sabethes cyaneus TaxID=53552 RepID=UPI00237E2F5F|nr:17-beta-hydroxysteroid dehydrogenase 13-like [Sabethes cyaneus]